MINAANTIKLAIQTPTVRFVVVDPPAFMKAKPMRWQIHYASQAVNAFMYALGVA